MDCSIRARERPCNADRLKVGWLNGFFIHQAHASRDQTLTGPLWEGFRESRRYSMNTYPESYITEYTLVDEDKAGVEAAEQSVPHR
jgi:hypothetical protein